MEKNLGHATAYGYAKSKGYTGTEEEFGVLMASYASVAQDASQSASSAAESAQLASNEAQKASQSATNAHNDAEIVSNIKTDVESARDTTVSAKNTTVEAKDISVEAKNSAISAKDTAENKAQIAEAWAVGQKDGTDVPSTDETYHNNAKYYSEQADIAKIGAESAQQLAQASATSASESASDASTSAQTASQAAQTATSKASEAITAATTATTKASEASTSAGTASSAATSASTSAQTATTAASTATTKASEASESATTATTAKTDAESARDAAAQSASRAEQSAESIDPDEFDRKIYAAFATDTATGAIASFADGADDIPMKDVLVHIEPVQEGSGDPSPDNVRPITGWTGAQVTRTGKNLLENKKVLFVNNIYLGTDVVDPSSSADTHSITLPAGTYTLSIETADGSTTNLYIAKVGVQTAFAIATNAKSITFTLFETMDLRLWAYKSEYSTVGVGAITQFQLELGSTTTDYEPYSGQTYDITFPSEAGTVYGGTLDVTTGELVVDRGYNTIGNIRWVYNNQRFLSDALSNKKAGITNIFSSAYATSSSGGAAGMADKVIKGQADNYRIIIADSTYTDIKSFQTAMGDVQIVYELASPITYTLTPQEITSLLGTNNLWADTGDSDVTYCVDPTLLLDNESSEIQNIKSMIAGVESSAVATKNYSIGDLVIVEDTLYEVTAAIASGETISASKVRVTTVDDAITKLKNDLTLLDNHVRYENENIIAENDIQTTSGTNIDANNSRLNISIANGASFRFRVNGTNLINQFALYYNEGRQNRRFGMNLLPNTNYDYTAPENVTSLYIYTAGTNVIGSGNLKLIVANVVHNNNSIDTKVSDLENTVVVLDNEVDGIKDNIDSKFKTSKNLFSTWSCGVVRNSDGSIIDKTDNPIGNNVVCLNYIPVEGGKRYTLSWDIDSLSDAAHTRYYIEQYDSNKSWLGVGYYIAAFGNTGHVSGVLDDNCAYVVLMGYISTGTDNWQAAIPLKTQFEQGGQSSYDNPLVIKEEYLDSEEIYKKLKSDGYFEENGNEIPAYYETHMEERANRINELAKTCVGTGDAFIFISDEHWTMNEKNSPSLINYIRNNTHINRLFSGGDNADRGSEDYCNALRLAFSGKIYHAIGNHEWFTPTNGHAIYYMADMYNNDQIGNPLEHYYYVDNVQQKIRYIILNAFIREDDSSTVTSGYSEEQLSWLTNTALNVDNGWDVIIITHYIGTTATGMEGSTAFRNAIDSFNNNSSSGKILAIMEGHGHYDAIFNTAGGIPIIMTTCDKNKPWIKDDTDMEPWITANRTSGTISEQAFDVMVVNRENKYISAIRIGSLAMDNYVHYQDNDFEPDGVLAERIVHYEKIDMTSSITLTPVITGTLTWKSRDTSIATVNNGTVTKVSSGKTIISAVNNNNQGEMWIISIT